MANPNTLQYLRYQDIQIPDVTLRQQFNNYMATGQYSQAFDLLNDNADQLKGKAYMAETINTIMNGILNLEGRFNDGVNLFLSNLATQYNNLVANLRLMGVWSNVTQYQPYNFVVYNQQVYLCLKQPPVGSLPTNTTYWLYLGLRGEVGAPGVNVVMQYDWVADVAYQPNDLVVYDSNIYVALKTNTGVEPTSDPTTWLLFIQTNKGGINVSMTAPIASTDNVIWFKPQSDPAQATTTTPILGQFYRYISDTGEWDEMYPNTLYTWVEGLENYAPEAVILPITIPRLKWMDKTWSYTYDKLTEQSIVGIFPNGLNAEQQKIYNGLTLSITDTTITLQSAITPTADLPIRIRIL